MRDHRKIKAFGLADEFVSEIYLITQRLPKTERYGLTSQIRRSAVSIPANIVEGCGRRSATDLYRFLDYSFSSLREVGYYLGLCVRLGYLREDEILPLKKLQSQIAKALAGYMRNVDSWKSQDLHKAPKSPAP